MRQLANVKLDRASFGGPHTRGNTADPRLESAAAQDSIERVAAIGTAGAFGLIASARYGVGVCRVRRI